jgi:cytochrome c oxidase subunit IV
MRTEARIFFGVTAFFVVIGAIYWFTSYEDAGSVMLVACAGLGILTGVYLAWQGRRVGLRPEDREDASVRDGAGPVGEFATASIWPVAVAGGATVMALGLVLGEAVFLLGGALFLVAVAGMIRETRARRRDVSRGRS